ncbi:MAG: ATP-dependent DNA helicase RecQ [Lentisphaerae bacterium GWF2_44_16]|nr:MAG: ATP-dependent DNA helicase RecQ [Lentisphaerae bacterium GWF2_44_16]HAU66170.1 DNA helicase RecQ [Candidatus Uhrbacteria bacterium]
MLERLKTYFGYDAFRPYQQEIIETVLNGEDVLVLLPTGGGKSLCYQLPSLMRDGITLVISPLIALMKDQVDGLNANGIPASYLNSSLSAQEIQIVQEQAVSGKLKLLYLAPERLGTLGFESFLLQLNVRLIAIDEAHCVSEWGHDFRPDYRRLVQLRTLFPHVNIIALTATATTRVRQDIVRYLAMPQPRVFLSSFNRSNLFYCVQPKQQAFQQLVTLLSRHKNESVIIYCFSRQDTEGLVSDLHTQGFKALAYHAGLEKQQRTRAQEAFIRDEVNIIVATIAFGMGIDKPDVRLIVHMDLPKTIEGYYQETGRAGRDGLPSECVLFYTYADKRKQDYFIAQIQDELEQAQAQKKLSDMIGYCESVACRRQYVLRYFGEEWGESFCGTCDVCQAPSVELQDATILSQKILSGVLRTGERFGAGYVCDVLRGSARDRVVENKHNQLSVYGIAKDASRQEIMLCIDSLLRYGFLEKQLGEYPTLRVSDKGKFVLKQREPILLPKMETLAVLKRTKKEKETDYDFDLFTRLRQLRKSLADEQGVPPFVVFGDRSLQEMSRVFPQDTHSFSMIFGVGETKLKQYGEIFVNCIVQYVQEKGITVTTPKKKVVLLKKERVGSTVQKTKELVEKKYSLEKIMKERKLARSTIVQHLEQLVQTGEFIDIEHLKPEFKRFQKIKHAFLQTHSNALTPVRALLGEEYSYDELRLVRLFL